MEELLQFLQYSKELTINPFGLGKASCNNRCKFCIVSNRMLNSDVPLEYFVETTNNTKKWLNKYLDTLPDDLTITFYFVAGELFYMNQDYFDLYKKVSSELYDIVKTKYDKIKFNIQSNFLFTDEKTINNFIDLSKFLFTLTSNVIVTTSFDLYGRFNDVSLNLWKKNLLYISQQLCNKLMIEIILTNQGLEVYNKSPNIYSNTLDYILSNEDKYNVSFEEFILNDIENKDMYPTTENLVEFYLKINEKFPTHHVLDIYKNPTNNINTTNSKPRSECTLIQFSDKPFNHGNIYTDSDLRIISNNCLGGILGNLNKYEPIQILKFIPKNNNGLYCLYNTQEVIEYFEHKIGCAFCKYKPYCSAKCFIQHIIKYYPEQCQRKELFKLFEKD